MSFQKSIFQASLLHTNTIKTILHNLTDIFSSFQEEISELYKGCDLACRHFGLH